MVLDAVDQAVPGGARGLFASFRKVVDDRGFPQVFGDLVPTQAKPVDPPDPALARSAVVKAAQSRVSRSRASPPRAAAHRGHRVLLRP